MRSRIIFGSPVRSDYVFPWMAHIEIFVPPNDLSWCGGAIISSRHILTAAHCVPKNATKIVVSIGSANKRKGQKIIPKRWYTHENFKLEGLHNDIAVIELPEKIVFDETKRPICLPPSDVKTTDKWMKTAGWGSTNVSVMKFSNDLLEIDVQDYNLQKCVRIDPAVITHKKICAKGLNGGNICHGDSGSPLMLKLKNTWTVVGVASTVCKTSLQFKFFTNCDKPDKLLCNPFLPSIFTRVSDYLDWIRSKIAITGHC